MANEPLLIAGGGIAGLAAALGLARSGLGAVVLEQAPVFDEVGAGLQLGPNAVKALKYLGAWDEIARLAFVPGRIAIRDGHNGQLLQEIALGGDFERRFGEPYRVIHRADLLAGLLASARASSDVTLKPGKRLIGFTESQSGVAAETAAGETFRGRALIGADGLRSTVRQKLIGDGPPRFAGQVLYRALIPMSAAPHGLDPAAVSLWLCPGAHVVHYPVSGGQSLNIVAASNDSWTDEGWSTAAEPAEVELRFPGCHPAVAAILAAPTTWTKWAGASRSEMRGWTKGRLALIGDAAHPMLPYLAQGAAMALEDAAVLSGLLAADRDVARAFSTYETSRRGRVSKVANRSRRQALIYHARGPLRLARNIALRLMDSGAFISRMAWLYGWEPPPRR